MTHEIDNALLLHGGEDDISIPGAALQQIVNDAPKPDCDDQISQLRAQVAALTNERDELIDRNQHLADERDYYKKRANDMEERAMGKVYD